jgi:hypothetical protein
MDYFTHYENMNDLSAAGLRRSSYQIKGDLESILSSRSGLALDIGCAAGAGLLALRAMGFTPEGIDADVQLAAISTALGFDVIVTREVESVLVERANTYNGVLLRDVIEHIPKEHVVHLLTAVYESPVPGGVAVIQTPNALSPIASYYRYIDFTHEYSSTWSLRHVLISAGFTDIVFRDTDWSWRASGKRLWRSESREALGRHMFRKVWRRVVIWELGIDPNYNTLPIDFTLICVAWKRPEDVT